MGGRSPGRGIVHNNAARLYGYWRIFPANAIAYRKKANINPPVKKYIGGEFFYNQIHAVKRYGLSGGTGGGEQIQAFHGQPAFFKDLYKHAPDHTRSADNRACEGFDIYAHLYSPSKNSFSNLA
jgi:hypothetical protein